MQPSPQRTFTRAEADALLPEVDRLLGEAQRLAAELQTAERQTQAQEWQVRANGHVRPTSGTPPEAQRRAIARQISAIVDRLQGMGIVLRDLRSGLIDFPSLREGRVVHLCWRRGEPLRIEWWHEVDVGFAGRQRLQDDEPGA